MPDGGEILPDSRDEPKDPNRLVINYLKSNFFRVVHADGAWVGLTPSLAVNVVLFSERSALPQRMTHELTPGGEIGAEVVSERLSKDGLVREMEVSLIMQPDRIKALIDVLQNMLVRIDQASKTETPSEHTDEK